MKDSNIDNSTNYPDDLNYSNQNWEMALEGIENHEKSVVRKRIYKVITAIGGLALILFYYQSNTTNLQAKTIKTNLNNTNYYSRINRTAAEVKTSVNQEDKNLFEDRSDVTLPSNSMLAINDITPVSKNKVIRNTDKNKSVVVSQTDKNSAKSFAEKNNNHTIDSGENVAFVNSAGDDSRRNKNDSNDQNLDDKILIPNRPDLEQEKDPNLNYSISSHSNDFSKNKESTEALHSIRMRPMPKNSYSFKINNSAKEVKKKKFHIPFQATSFKVSISPWVQYGKSNYWSGINPSMGLEFERNGNNPDYSFSIGINYFEISELPLTISREETSLSYGYESTITSVKTDQLHFVSIPLIISRRIKERLQVGAGLGTSFLVTTSNTITKTHESNFSSEVLSSEKTNGFFQGFNRLTYYSMFEGRFWVTQNLAFGANYQFGLSDFSKNDQFDDEIIHSNSKIELSLKYIIR